jgi:hypothetical protein
MGVPEWKKHWKALDEWKDLVTEREIERDLYKIRQAPKPPTTSISRPNKPNNLEHIEVHQHRELSSPLHMMVDFRVCLRLQ